MAFRVRALLELNAGRIEYAKKDLREVTKVLAELKPDNAEAQEAITNARIAELDELEVPYHRQVGSVRYSRPPRPRTQEVTI